MRREQVNHKHSDEFLNRDLGREEVLKAIENAEFKKAFDIDELPNMVLKATSLFDLLYCLLKTCFDHSIVPSVWFKSIITPILKSPKDDPKVPLNYQGMSLLSSVYKLYSSILNNRIVQPLEQNSLLEEEQYSFRNGRACVDHIYLVLKVVRHRLKNNKATFLCLLVSKKRFILLTMIFYNLSFSNSNWWKIPSSSKVFIQVFIQGIC